MSIAPAQQQAPAGRAARRVHVLLENVSWQAYEALLESWQEDQLRLTYDRGRLEIMSPLHIHEQYAGLVGRFIETYTLLSRIPLHSGGSTTFKQSAIRKGLEPDRCYWIQNEPRMRGRFEHDLETDPPPDVAVEADHTSSSLDKMSIYADLGVLEVWLVDNGSVTIHLLRGSGYETMPAGRALPALSAEVVNRFLAMRAESSEDATMAAFMQWVLDQKQPEAAKPKPKRPRKK